MASNGSTITDEDGDFSDWLEVHNPDSEPLNLAGYLLTDREGEPKWTFPEKSLPPGGYLLVFASGKDRREPDAELHTNFRLSAGGEYLGLIAPDGETVSAQFAPEYPRQRRDISYGLTQVSRLQGFFSAPTPGLRNGDEAALALPEVVTFSEPSQTFETNLVVALSSAAEGATIRYTTDGQPPTEDSFLYEEPLIIDATTVLRAAVITENGISGESRTNQYLRLSPSLTERRSHLPLVVLDASGATLDGETRRGGAFWLFDRESNGISSLSSPPDLVTRQGLRLRGSSSQRFPKKPYSVEFWDESDNDLDLELLGMPADSDWVFYSPYNFDRVYTRNALAYELSRQIGRYAPRTRFVEVFVNQDGGDLTEADRVGVYSIVESLQMDEHRIGSELVSPDEVPPEGSLDLEQDGAWTGGYLLKVDRRDADELVFTSSRNTRVVLDDPKLDELDGGPYTRSNQALSRSGQANYISSYYNEFANRLESERQVSFAERSYEKFIDSDSFVDFFLLILLSKNVDGLRLSSFMHKPENEPLVAGPVWDFDRAYGSRDSRDDDPESWNGPHFDYFTFHIWNALTSDPAFAQAFYDRWASLRQGAFNDDAMSALIRSLSAEISASSVEIDSAATRDAAIWIANSPANGSYEEEVAAMESWVLSRMRWMDRRSFDSARLPEVPYLRSNGDEINLLGGAQIYFTTDGRDPRTPDGAIAGQRFTGPLRLEPGTLLNARTLTNGRWSTPLVKRIGEVPTNYSEWQSLVFSDSDIANEEHTDPLAIAPDGESPNILLFALGIVSTTPTSPELPQLASFNGELRYRIPYPNDLEGIRRIVESTDDLSDWSAATILFDSALSGESEIFEEILEIPLDTTESTRFYRFRVEAL